jgi:hypothetical protein
VPTETCVELVAAEVLSTIRLEVDPNEPLPVVRRVRSGATEASAAPAAMPAPPVTPSPFVEALVTGLDAADPGELDRRLYRAAALEQRLLAEVGRLLFALAQARGHFDLGFRSLDAYARERLGIAPRKARALLRVERACALAPSFGEAWRAGRITGSQAQALVPLVLAPGSEPFHAAWIARAGEVTVRRLEDDVEHALASGRFDPAALPDLPADLPGGVQIGAEHMGGRETDVWVANVPADVGRLFRACLYSVARRSNLSPDSALEAMFEHCDDANLTTLCAAHHQRGVHVGGIRITGRAPDGLVFELPLGRFSSGDRALPPRGCGPASGRSMRPLLAPAGTGSCAS